jgi:hypothetical protein
MVKKFKNSVVFSQPWGGLGDNLGFTNLPELFNASGIAFYISRLNYTRNKDIYDLCWGHNEFVKKLKRTIPNIGFKILDESGYKVFDEKYNIVQNVNVAHGFDPGYGYPKIKLPSNIKNISNEHFDHVVDFKAHSILNDSHFSYDEESFNEKIKYYTTSDSFNLAYPQIYELNKKNKNTIEVTNLNRLISILLKTNTFDVEINNHRIQNKRGQYYFDNVKYEKINIINKNNDKSEHKDLQEITKNMSKSLKYHRRIFYYQKRISTFLGN